MKPHVHFSSCQHFIIIFRASKFDFKFGWQGSFLARRDWWSLWKLSSFFNVCAALAARRISQDRNDFIGRRGHLDAEQRRGHPTCSANARTRLAHRHADLHAIEHPETLGCPRGYTWDRVNLEIEFFTKPNDLNPGESAWFPRGTGNPWRD